MNLSPTHPQRVPTSYWRIGLIALCAAACRPKSETVAAADVSATSTASPFPLYWLADTTLYDHPGGTAVFTITTRTQVTLLPNGRVRSPAGAKPTFEGAIAPELLHEPQPHRGFMLYAQRDGDVRFRHADGPVLGRLHAGALVSVAPAEVGRVRIGSLPFERGRERIEAFVDREILGVEPREPAPYRPSPPFWSVRAPSFIAWIYDPSSETIAEGWWTVPCRDVWVWPEAKRVSQYVDGIEVLGTDDAYSARGYNPVAIFESLSCPAPAVFRHETRFAWVDPARSASPIDVDTIPQEYERYSPIDSDPIREALSHGSQMYWLLPTTTGLVCDEWKFRPGGEPDKGYLVRKKLIILDDRPHSVRFPVTLAASTDRGPATLRLEALEMDGRSVFASENAYTYAILAKIGPELRVTGRPLSPDLVAYDPAETERWFLSRPLCEVARNQIEKMIATGTVPATRLGIHASIATFGI